MVKTELGGFGHLNGTSRFQATTLIGNWSEEREVQRAILRDMLAAKTGGTTKIDGHHGRMALALNEVELSKVADDDLIHFGDVIQLMHVEKGYVIAGDVSEKDPRPAEEAVAATAAPEVRSPCSRNTFLILRPPPGRNSSLESEYDGPALRYGQKFRLALNPNALGEPLDAQGGSLPLCLYAKPVSMQYSAKYSKGKPLVGLTHRSTSAETLWQVLVPDPSQRAISEGLEVMAGAPVLLVHAMTQQVLQVLTHKYPTQFGLEFELSCDAASSKHSLAIIGGSKVEQLSQGVSQDAASSSKLEPLVAELKGKDGALDSFIVRLLKWSNKENSLPADELLLLARLVGSTLPEADIQSIATAFSFKPSAIDVAKLLSSIRQLS